ncbi:IS21 family transposase [Nostocoides sp. F2B08]|nr:IS21 family transposase [Tetrasphaera sp. F2B08]
MEQFEDIRRDHRDGMTIRALARKHRVHRRTVRYAIAQAEPPARKVTARESPVTGRWEPLVRSWLVADLDAPRKQRHTARRVWQRLLEEHDARVSESAVRLLVARLKREVGLSRVEAMVPQTHPPGAEAEVDFGEFYAVLAGEMTKLWMFVMRCSYSGKAVHFAYANQAQESFLDGHVRAFAALGGVPGLIRYDNLKPAVIRVLLGRERFEHPRFITMRSHYGYESFYCIPGKDGAHEKGGVEGEIGRFRRRHMVPVPHVGSMAALDAALSAADARDDQRYIDGRRNRIGQDFAVEAALLIPLPERPFRAVAELSCRVDAKARICVRQSYYSVPARFVGGRVRVELGARTVTALDGTTVIARHPRSLHKRSEDLVLDHYLEVLVRKPGALPGSTALATARANGTFTATHQRCWDAARSALGDAGGTRALIGALLLYRSMPAADVDAGIAAATRAGMFHPDVVTIEARAHATGTTAPTPVPIPQHATPAARATRALPDLTGYDHLLNGATP